MKKLTESYNESFCQKLDDLFHLVNRMQLLADNGYLDTNEDSCIFADDVQPQDVIDFLKSNGYAELKPEDLDAMCKKIEDFLK